MDVFTACPDSFTAWRGEQAAHHASPYIQRGRARECSCRPEILCAHAPPDSSSSARAQATRVNVYFFSIFFVCFMSCFCSKCPTWNRTAKAAGVQCADWPVYYLTMPAKSKLPGPCELRKSLVTRELRNAAPK